MVAFFKYLKNNLIVILCFIFLIILVIYSFYDYINTYYSFDYDKTVELYYQSLESCEKNYDSWCDDLSYPLTPKEEFKKLDAKTLYFEIIYHHFSNYAVLLIPLFMIIIIISKIHRDFSSGIIKTYLMRENFRTYKNKMSKTIIKYALIIPLFLFLIFIISCLLTRFNFKVDKSVYSLAVYNKWDYNYFPIYIIIHYFIFVFACCFYGNLSLCFLNKHKNSFVVSLLSYISFLLIVFLFSLLQIVVYKISISCNISVNYLHRILNILDFLDIYGFNEVIGCLIMSFILLLLSFGLKEFVLKNKEKVIVENEKEII